MPLSTDINGRRREGEARFAVDEGLAERLRA